MNTRSTIVFLLLVVPICRADIIYNVDFENPPHVLDAPVVTGGGSDRPSGTTGNVVVRDSPGDFTTQVASLEPAGSMGFNPGTPSSAGLVLISWDMAILSLGGNPGAAFMAVQGSAAGAVGLIFNQDLTIDDGGGMQVGVFALGQQVHFEYAFDLDNDFYNLSMNGSPVQSNQSLDPAFDIQNVLFTRDSFADPDYAIDNFQWQTIPEPSTFLLTVLGLFVFGLRRRNGSRI
jgi:hypothetical protein